MDEALVAGTALAAVALGVFVLDLIFAGHIK